MPDYSNQALINNIVGRIFIPIAQQTFTDETLMMMANNVLQDEIVPLIMAGREEYFVNHVDVTPINGVVAIPAQAVGIKLRMVCIVTSNGNINNLQEVTLDTLAGWGNGYNYNNGYTNGGYNIQGNNIYLYPPNMAINGQIRLYYFEQPLVLEAPAKYGKVLAVDSETNTVTLDNVDVDWVTGVEVNAVNGQPNFDITNRLATIVTITGFELELDDVIGISVGDYVSAYGTSAVAQIPVQAIGLLAELTGAKALQGLGDKDGAKMALDKAEMLRRNVLTVITQRVDASPKKIVHPDGGLVGSTGFGWWGRKGW